MVQTREDRFRSIDTHRIAMMPGNALLCDSEDAGWAHAYLSHAREGAWRARLGSLSNPCIALNLAGTTRVSCRTADAGRREGVLTPRRFSIIPPDEESEWEISDGAEILLVYLRRETFDGVARAHDVDPARAAVLPRFCHADPFVEQLCLNMLATLREEQLFGAYSPIHADYLAHMLIAHLFREHSMAAQALRGGRIARGFSRPTTSGDAFRRVIDWIDAELDGPLTLDRMAARAGMHPLRFARSFRRAHGITPHRFVMDRRLERARQLIATSDMPIAQVALATGFSSQSHLTTAFTRAFGLSPGRYRRNG